MSLVIKTKDELSAEADLRDKELAQREARGYLASTDWMIVRQAETGTPTPEHVIERRAAARALLSE